MEVTSDLIDWFPSHTELNKLRSEKFGSGPGRDFVNFLWPAGLGYFAPLNPTFLTEVSGLVALGARPMCLVRDGLVPLLWFFREFPEPKDHKGWLLVHSELAPFVPTAWREVAGHYHLRNDRQLFQGSPARKINRLLLTGVMMDAYCDIDDLEERLEKVCEDLGAARSSLEEVVAFIPARFDGFGVEHRHEYPIDYVAMLSRFFGSKLKGITWNRFDASDSWEGYAVCDLNSRLACADSYMVHRALGKGGLLVGEPSWPVSASARWIPLSPFHGVEVAFSISDKCVVEKGSKLVEEMTAPFEQKFMHAMRSEANRRFPWPTWFAHWAQIVAAGTPRGRSRAGAH